MAEEDNFFSRWSRRKVQVRQGGAPEAAPPVAPPDPLPRGAREQELAVPPASLAPLAGKETAGGRQAAEDAPPLPTLADVAALTRDSDYKRFVMPGVDEGVKRAAMKKMFFSDPHFNVMDGLDTYIGDYNTPDPIPASMLRQMTQAKFLGLFDDEDTDKNKTAAAITVAAVTSAPPAAAARIPANVETGAPADAPGGRADDDTDL
jgi:hypothetical protein